MSPIISAAAVEAVRDGFLIEFDRASTPATPPIFVAGQPMAEASGRTSRGASIVTPRKMPSTPAASSARLRPVDKPCPKAP